MGVREKLLDGVKKTKESVLSSLVSLQETSLALRNSLATADMFSLGKHPLVCTFPGGVSRQVHRGQPSPLNSILGQLPYVPLTSLPCSPHCRIEELCSKEMNWSSWHRLPGLLSVTHRQRGRKENQSPSPSMTGLALWRLG